MNISLAHFLKISGSEAELLAVLDGLNLVSTYMSNEGWRDRQILHLFFGGEYLRARCKKLSARLWFEVGGLL